MLRAARVPVHVMAARLGHADPAVTLRIYSHVLPEHTLGVGDVFAQAVKASVSNLLALLCAPPFDVDLEFQAAFPSRAVLM